MSSLVHMEGEKQTSYGRKGRREREYSREEELHPRPLCTLRRVAYNDPGRVGRTATSTGSTLGRSVKITFCRWPTLYKVSNSIPCAMVYF